MKRGIFGAFAAAFFLLAVGCSDGGAGRAVDVQQVADGLIQSVKFQDQMSALKQETAVKLYGFEAGDVVKAGVYESTGATAEEVAAFEAKDAAAAGRVKEKVEERIEAQRAGFKDYQPAEMAKLEDPVVVAKGNYVILCVSDDNAGAQKAIDGYFGS